MKQIILLLPILLLSACSTSGSSFTNTFTGNRETADITNDCTDIVAIFFKQQEDDILGKILKNALTPSEVTSLVGMTSSNFLRAMKQFNTRDEKNIFLKFVFTNFSLAEFNGFIDKNKLNKTILKELRTTFDSIPNADSFFTLFDLFDTATIKKAKSQALSYKFMLDEASKYSEKMEAINIDQIQTSDDFLKAAADLLDMDLTFRKADVVMGSNQKNKYMIQLSGTYVDKLANNKLLSLATSEIKNDKPDSYLDILKKQGTEEVYKAYARRLSIHNVEVTYFSVENLKSIRPLLSKIEYQNIIKLKSKEATELATQILMNKMFNPEMFESIIRTVFGDHEIVNPYSLYKAFISLHPFNDGNGRAARFYYKWLVTHYFKAYGTNPKFLINDGDVFFDNFPQAQSQLDFTWYASRLWALGSKNENELIKRSNDVLRKSDAHSSIIDNIIDSKKILEAP